MTNLDNLSQEHLTLQADYQGATKQLGELMNKNEVDEQLIAKLEENEASMVQSLEAFETRF